MTAPVYVSGYSYFYIKPNERQSRYLMIFLAERQIKIGFKDIDSPVKEFGPNVKDNPSSKLLIQPGNKSTNITV